ncbi:MAG: FISUMP domain-containing protein [Candidatus Falkowbacteria bacterium]
MFSFKFRKTAFTLIELLVVIAIIGILATISVLALSNARAKSRDAKRVGDIKQVSTALELFFNDNNRYPTLDEWSTGQIYSTSSAGTSTYMQIIPSAPTPSDGACNDNQNLVNYTPAVDGSSYSISFCLGNTTGTLTPGPKCLTPGGIMEADCSSSVCGYTLIDSRDGQLYPTVQIGTQCWTAKNMNIGSRVGVCSSGDCSNDCASTCTVRGTTFRNQDNNNIIEKYCYNDNENNCNIYGGLYQWAETLQLPGSCSTVTIDCTTMPTDPCCGFATPIQGICPDGWHVPSDTEQNALDQYLTDSPTCNASRINPYECNNAGKKLKETGTSHWTLATSTNAFGFTALGAGQTLPAGAYGNQGIYTYFWSSSASITNSFNRGLSNSSAGVGRFRNSRYSARSVRCLKN